MKHFIERILAAFFAVVMLCNAAYSQVAVDAAGSRFVRDVFGNLHLSIAMDRRTVYRVVHLNAPPRIALDLKDADLGALVGLRGEFGLLTNAGRFTENWSRMIFTLSKPQTLASAAFVQSNDQTVLELRFKKNSEKEFTRFVQKSIGANALQAVDPVAVSKDRFLVALDPGHGGIDPGASRDGIAEKDIALQFALEVADLLRGTKRYDVFLTRDDDRFVSLSERVLMARQSGADIFISLHANTVTKGNASGATMYVLSEKASDPASAALAALENRADQVAGWIEREQDSDIVNVLKDMAANATAIRSRSAAKALVASFDSSVGVIQSHPLRSANFKVLTAHDMPSVLVELGFMTNSRDLKRMTSPEWRAKAADALLNALDMWKGSDPEKVMLTVSGQ